MLAIIQMDCWLGYRFGIVQLTTEQARLMWRK